MKKAIKIILIIVVIALAITLAIITSLKEKPKKENYTNSIYVLTDSGHGYNYYQINNEGKIRTVINFEPSPSDKYYLKNCFTSHVDVDSGKILNEYKADTCIVTDSNNNSINLDDTLKDIINKSTNYYNPINDVLIIKINENYYVTINFIIDQYTPYKLYYYDKNRLKLRHIYTFDKESVVAIKENDKFIFEK